MKKKSKPKFAGLEKGADIQKKLPRPILLEIEDIELGNAGRNIDNKIVDQLMIAIKDQGLQHPIHVFRLKHPLGKYGLAAGQHRLAAFRKLGHREIPAIVLKRQEAMAWKASENLHRSNLSALDKSIAIVNYARARPAEECRGGQQPHDLGYSKIARILKMSRRRVERAHNHVALPSSVKKEIKSRKDLNKIKILDELARFEDEDEQLRYLQQKKTLKQGKVYSRDESETKKKKTRPSVESSSRTSLLKLTEVWETSGLGKLFANQSWEVKAAFVGVLLR